MTTRWALIGASDVASTRMIPAMRRLGHQVTAIGDPTPEWAATYAARNDIAVSGSVEDVIQRDDVDAIYVSTRNEFHVEHTLLAAREGKHVLCEKPLALSVADAQEMIAACESAGVVLGTNHHLPGSGVQRAMRELTLSGAIGALLAVRVFHAVMLPQRLQGWRLGKIGGGVALDVTCHDAAVLNQLMRALPQDVVALAVKQGPWEASAEDALMSTMRYADGTLIQTHDALTVQHAATGMHIIGTEGAISATGVMGQEPVASFEVRDAKGEHEVAVQDLRDLYEIGVAGFAAAVRGETDRPIVTGADGLQALQLALAVQRAADTGQRAAP